MSSIVALATTPGHSALALLRLSGPLSSTLFPDLVARRATLRTYRDLSGAVLDQVLTTSFAAPASFTGEAMLELACHGNPLIIQKIIADLLARGFVMAAPGEFTRRAFLNGKIDLTQAEAIAELISARSERALSAAHRVLAGELGTAIRTFADKLLSVIAGVEAYIDFPDEDLPPESPLHPLLSQLITDLKSLKSTQNAHRLTHSGAKLAIIGAPNAGKSSIFNALVGHDRALVSPEAGTTRDYLETPITLAGHALLLVDTAGLNATPGTIEAMGIAKTHDQLATADIILWVIDGTQPAPAVPQGVDWQRTIVAANKSDLPSFTLPTLAGAAPLAISATTSTGLEALKSAIVSHLVKNLPATDTLMVSSRHADALAATLTELSTAQELLTQKATPELIAHHLHQALGHLGEILGKFDNEQVLDKLFGSFCIGK